MLLGLGLLSCLLITLEASTRLLDPLRSAVGDLVGPIYLVAESPYFAAGLLSETLSSRDRLLQRNRELERRLLELGQVSQQFVALKSENERLRTLLGSQARVSSEVLIAELVGVIPDTEVQQIVIDKGSADGVEVGQAVLDAQGLFGQVVEVSGVTSRVLMLTDRDHAVPVRINRNGIRSIAGGTGDMDSLVLENVGISADIIEGDLVETSGLGGRFPPGYPVGTVSSIVKEPTFAYAQVRVRPQALLDRSHHVLVILSRAAAPANDAEPVAPAEAAATADGASR